MHMLFTANRLDESGSFNRALLRAAPQVTAPVAEHRRRSTHWRRLRPFRLWLNLGSFGFTAM